jgi:hypothetical protein
MLESNSEELVKTWAIKISKQHMVGCLDRNAGLGKDSTRHTARRTAQILYVLSSGNPKSCQNLLKKFCVVHIYNADVKGSFNCTTPDGRLSYIHANVPGTKE